MRNVRVFLSIAALANLAVALWHLYLAVEMHPGLLGTAPVRIAILTGALTLVSVALVWTRYPKIGSLVLIVVLALGFLMGCVEHFFVAGPYNVSDVGGGHWVLPFNITVALLVVFQLAGLFAAVRMLAWLTDYAVYQPEEIGLYAIRSNSWRLNALLSASRR